MKRRARQWSVAAASLAVLGTAMAPSHAFGAVHAMRPTKIVVSGKTFSAPPAFTYQNTTYMPIYYVQSLLHGLGIQDSWNGAHSPQVWSLTTHSQSPISKNIVCKTGSVNIFINNTMVCKNVFKIVDTDPNSHQPTTFVPIWYIQETLRALGLTNDWNGNTWTISPNYTDFSKSGKNLGQFATVDDAEFALVQYPGGVVKDKNGNAVYTEQDFTNVDLRQPAPSNVTASSIDKFLADHNSPLAGLGASFMAAQNTYGVNAAYLVAHAIQESAWGTSPIALAKNNLFGYGAFDASSGTTAGTFPSLDCAIRFQAWEVRNNYLEPGSIYYVTPTLAGMQQNYASDTGWAASIGTVMNQFAIYLGDTVQSYPQYTNGASAPAPASTEEPAYALGGAQGTVGSVPYYGSLPVYPDMASGVQQMFVRTLQNGASGNDVRSLQTALNQQAGAGLIVDGKFGPATQTAITQYQSTHSLPTTGTVDFNMWTMLHVDQSATTLPAGTSLNVDQVKQGMAGGNVALWYHVAGQGWVNGTDVSLSNVYRLTVADPKSPAQSSVNVYDPNNTTTVIATLHAGDFVVAGVPSQTTVSFADPSGNGQMLTGVIRSATLAKAASN